MKTIISNQFLTATILNKGAELCSLKTLEKEYIWNGNPQFWGKHSPILFPIVGTLINNSYEFENQHFDLARHGFARDMNFELISNTGSQASFLLTNTADTISVFPFEFQLIITYILEKNKLSIQYKVLNGSEKIMPFSIGAHPAFALDNNFENYSLDFRIQEVLEYNLLENDLLSNKAGQLNLTDKKLNLNYELFENDALVFKKLKSKSITILEDDKAFLTINFDDFPSLGIWTKKDAPFICIEPWFGFADEATASGKIVEKNGILLLDKKSEWQTEFDIEIV
jgi:galactose mutarotase-like enzyme